MTIAVYSPPHHSGAGRFNTTDKAYQFRFSKITQGTNHVVFSGNSGLARLKRLLYQSSLRPLCRVVSRSVRAHWYSRTTPTNTTILWVGWTRKDYSYTLTNDIPHPSRVGMGLLRCFLSEPGGRSSQMSFFTASEAPFVKEMVGAWEMPADLTNWAGCTVHLREYGGQGDIATLQLQ